MNNPEQEPNWSEIAISHHDKIVCFFALDMADKLAERDRYSFTRSEYPKLELYEQVVASRGDDETLSVELTYYQADEQWVDTYTYYPEHRQLVLTEKYSQAALEGMRRSSAHHAEQKAGHFSSMLKRVTELAKDSTDIALALDVYNASPDDSLSFIFLIELAQSDPEFARHLEMYDAMAKRKQLIDDHLLMMESVAEPQPGDAASLTATLDMVARLKKKAK